MSLARGVQKPVLQASVPDGTPFPHSGSGEVKLVARNRWECSQMQIWLVLHTPHPHLTESQLLNIYQHTSACGPL